MDDGKMSLIFSHLCDDFLRLLKNEELTTADRKVLLEFLRDNDVSVVGANNSQINSIVQNLPFSDEDTEQLKH